MKKLFKNKTAMFALAVLSIVATFLVISSPVAGLAFLATFPMIVKVGGKDFTVKTQEEKDQMDQLVALVNAITDKAIAGVITKEEMIKAIEDKVAEKGFKIEDDAKFKEFAAAVTKLSLEITGLKEHGPQVVGKTLGQQFKDYMIANPEAMKSLTNGNVKELKITFKVAGNMLDSTNTGSHTIPAAVREPGLNDVAVERKFIMDIIGSSPTTSKVIEFTEKTNKDGTVVFVLDTEAFAQIDFDLDVNSSTAKDVGAYITVHENMLADIDFMASEIDKELVYEIKEAADGEILSGAGTTYHLKGLDEYASAFSLTTIAQTTPNIGDCIAAAMTQVESVGFDQADLIIIHPVDYNNLIGTKDDNGRYVGHPFLSPDGQNFAGVPISRTTFMPAGYLLVGSKRKSNIKILENITLAMGYNLTGEFTKRLITVRGSMRLHHYIKANDTGSFVYDAIADIKAAITAI